MRSAELHALGVIGSMLRLTDKSSVIRVVFGRFFVVASTTEEWEAFAGTI